MQWQIAVVCFPLVHNSRSAGAVLLQALAWLELAQGCGLGLGVFHGSLFPWTRGYLGMLSLWQRSDRCTRAQPNHATDFKSPLALHLSHSTAKASTVAKSRVSGTGQDILLIVERRGVTSFWTILQPVTKC